MLNLSGPIQRSRHLPLRAGTSDFHVRGGSSYDRPVIEMSVSVCLRVLAPTFAAILLAACDSAAGNQANLPSAGPTESVTATATTTPTPSPSATPTPTLPPTKAPTPTTKAPVVPTASATAPPQPPFNYCGAPVNPWHYNFCSGNVIYAVPSDFCSYFPCIPSFWKSTNGYAEECMDGKYSHSGGRPGACSYHGGEQRPLLSP